MEREEELKLCYEMMADEFKITKEQARKIVKYIEIDDIVIDYYQEVIYEAEAIEEAEEQARREKTWDREIKMNPDLYKNDIHGGV